VYKKNVITILMGLLVLQAALIAFVYRPGQDQAPPSVALMAAVDVQAITSMKITDENGHSVIIQKQGTDWIVGKDKFPADKTSLEEIFKRIAGLESARLVSRTKSSHNRLKVGEALFNRKVVLGSDKGDFTFFMGTAPSSKSVHLRVSGQNEVYQVSGIAAWELQADAESWWQPNYVQLDPESIQAITITNTNGTFSLQRNDGRKWRFETDISGELDQDKVAALLDTVAKIPVAAYLPKDFSIETSPVCTIQYQVDGKSISLQIWPKSDQDDHVAKLSDAAFYVKIRNYVIKEALGTTIHVLLTEEDHDQDGGKTIP